MNQRIQLYVLGAVAAVLAFVLYSTYFGSTGTTTAPGITAADTTFHPLDIQEPQLRMDLLDRIQKSEYSGTHRNVFIAAPPPPPPQLPGQQSASLFVGPRVPPPPPPLQVPGEFFGYASASGSGRRVAFFKNGDDLQLLAEGDTFRNNLRVVHIGDDSVEVEEVPGGRHATVKMVQPAPGSDAPQP